MTMATNRGDRQNPSRTRSDHVRARAATVPAMPAARAPSTAAPPPSSGRPAIVIDDFGGAAVRLAARIPRSEVPRRTSAAAAAGASLGESDLALLELIDGRRTVGAIVERSGETSARVGAGLCRLERLRLIAF